MPIKLKIIFKIYGVQDGKIYAKAQNDSRII